MFSVKVDDHGEHVPYKRSSGTIDRIKPFHNFSLRRLYCGDDECGWGAWQVAVRYSYLDLSDKDILGGVENDVTAALVWYFNDHASLQFNTVYGDIRDHAAASGFTGGHFTPLAPATPVCRGSCSSPSDRQTARGSRERRECWSAAGFCCERASGAVGRSGSSSPPGRPARKQKGDAANTVRHVSCLVG